MFDPTKLSRPISQYTNARLVADDEAGYSVWLSVDRSLYCDLVLQTHDYDAACALVDEANQYIRAFKRLKGELNG